eukprot:TRINITY_DN61174_c0_g1_i1.p2 TRINITY_DN61174_c0_g1~~TRINITY_DN61174_c0_g1_i1.p2  ORF type:complete len:115 (+),score=0.53 TRINITY_DN61174_c0_g1_i1:496-840(+)
MFVHRVAFLGKSKFPLGFSRQLPQYSEQNRLPPQYYAIHLLTIVGGGYQVLVKQSKGEYKAKIAIINHFIRNPTHNQRFWCRCRVNFPIFKLLLILFNGGQLKQGYQDFGALAL